MKTAFLCALAALVVPVSAAQYGGGVGSGYTRTAAPYFAFYAPQSIFAGGGGGGYARSSATPGIVLPVELVAFTALLDGGDAVVLHWQTASETNNAGFHVQHRAPDAPDFADVSFVDGQGTTAAPHVYAHRVAALAPGRHAFRLAQVDFDGTRTFGPEAEAVVGLPDRYVFSAPYPNPGAGRVTFTLAVRQAQYVRVDVLDVQGRRVAVLHDGPLGAATAHRFTLGAATLPGGIYAVRATGEYFRAVRQVVLVQ